MSNLDDEFATAGRLVSWRARAVHPDDPRPHPAPPSHNQAEHLAASQRPGNRPNRWYGLAVDLPDPVDLDALGRALHQLVFRHDTLRSGFRHDAGGALQRWLLPDAATRLVREDTGSVPDVAAHLEHELHQTADPRRWPAYLFTAVLRPTGNTLLLAFDHSVTDLYSLALSAHEVLERYAGRDLVPPDPGSFLDLCLRERMAAADRVADAARRWNELFTAASPPRFPLNLGLHPGATAPLRWDEFPLADAGEADRFERRCRQARSGMTAGLLAALAIAGGNGNLRVICPVQTRDRTTSAAIGWFVNAIPVAFDAPIEQNFPLTARHATTSVQEAMSYRDVPWQQAVATLPEATPSGPASWFSYIDFQRLPVTAVREGRARILTGRRTGLETDIWMHRTLRGLRAQVRYPDTDQARHSVRQYLARYASVVRAVAADHAPGPP